MRNLRAITRLLLKTEWTSEWVYLLSRSIPLNNLFFSVLRTEFPPSTGHESKGKKHVSVTYSRNRYEVNNIFILSLLCP